MATAEYFKRGGGGAPLEDLLIGFLFGGIAAVIYEIIFKKNLRHTTISHKNGFIFLVATSLILCASMFSLIKVNSFTAIVTAMVLATAGILSVRKDLIRSSLYSGFLTLLVALPFYILIYVASPEWAMSTYKFGTLSGTVIYGFPIEEFIFWFFFGLVIGPIYEYAKGWGFK
ncbi:MAG: lycopene cyclase domain-containing protein [bacterium]|nr:lycopene cyclase domain-containing protein [bacterium]